MVPRHRPTDGRWNITADLSQHDAAVRIPIKGDAIAGFNAQSGAHADRNGHLALLRHRGSHAGITSVIGKTVNTSSRYL